MNRRRWVYPLVALLTAAAVLVADRLLARPAAKHGLPPVRYTGPLEMRPAPPDATTPAPPAEPAPPQEPAMPGR